MIFAKRGLFEIFFAVALLWASPPSYAEPLADYTSAVPAADRSPLLIELPVADIPFNTAYGFSFPSMPQSIAITGGVTQAAHHAFAVLWQPQVPDPSLKGLMNNRKLGGLWSSILLFDMLSPFRGWTHEEAHRAVLSSRGISSRNDIYRNPFAEMVSVSHVLDEDLARLKDSHPADMVRLAEAGGEAQLESSFRMRKANFVAGRSSKYDLVDWWVNAGTIAWYVWYCGNDEVNGITEEETRKEDADVSKRDIVGADYLSWVYDLFRPDEPYLSGLRGRPHPSGVGVDRYIQPSELTGDELRYLRLQGRLIFLNFISPQMFGFNRFRGTNPITHRRFWWNAAVTHHLTSFGTATGLHFFFQQGRTNLVFTYNSYISRTRYWPGLSIDLVRYPVEVAGKILSVSTSASAWLQPLGQRFASTKARAGCGVTLGASYPLARHLEWTLECDTKSEGWMAGNVYLDAAVQFRTGMILLLK